jgi:hypothetical protein
MVPYAAVGFGFAVVGALVLGRHAHPAQPLPAEVLPDSRDETDPVHDVDPRPIVTASDLTAWATPILSIVGVARGVVAAPWRKPA